MVRPGQPAGYRSVLPCPDEGVMRLAVATCGDPACRTKTEMVIEDKDGFIKCSVCGQRNHISEWRPVPGGRCDKCGRPMDDHYWIADTVNACPN